MPPFLAWWPLMERHAGSRQSLRAWLEGQPALPGFGHALYPDGDPRARCLLECLPNDVRLLRLLEAVDECTGTRPSLDFALVALRRAIGAPEGAAFAIFAISRTVGWLAHAFEQGRSGQLIRPRADYNGPRPLASTPPAPGRVVKRR